MSRRIQTGALWKENGAWFGRWRQDVLQPDGTVKRVRYAKKLCDYSDRYRNVSDVQPLLDEILRPINEGHGDARGTMRLTDFFEKHYKPEIEREKRPSTAKGYKEIWANHVKPRIGDIPVRDFRTVDGSKLLKAIAAKNDLGKATLQHIKSMLSGVFTFAKNEGLYDGVNPMQDVLIPKARRPGQTHVYSLWEIRKMLRILPPVVRAFVAVAAYTGLRRGEIGGLEWQDYTGDSITVSRSLWRGRILETKTEASSAPVPVIPELANVLKQYRATIGNPKTGPIFSGVQQDRIDLDKLGTRIVRPIIQAAGLKWRGWHAFRRGLATNLHDLGVPDLTIQAILRHSNVSVTQRCYIKTLDRQTVAAMSRLQSEIERTPEELASEWPVNSA
jgi:integrase